MKKGLIGWLAGHVADCRDNPRRYIDTYGANLAGHCWNGGSGLQFLLGSVTLSGREVVAGCINMLSGAMSQFFGHTRWGIPMTAGLGWVGSLLTFWPALIAGEITTWLSFLFLSTAQCIGIFNEQLSQRFGQHSAAWLRQTLGNPRRTAGLFFGVLLSRIPMIVDCIIEQRWKLLAASILWTMGDLFYSFSKPVAARDKSEVLL